jgi:hypothetical protein
VAVYRAEESGAYRPVALRPGHRASERMTGGTRDPGRWQVELGPLLYGCCISWRMQEPRIDAVSDAAHDNTTECDALEGQAYRLVLSGASSHLATCVWLPPEPVPGTPAGSDDDGSGESKGSGAGVRSEKVADAPVVAMRIDEAQGWTDVATGRPVGRPHLQRVLGLLDALLLRPRAAPLAMLLPPAAPVILRQFAISKCSPREGARRGGGDSVHARGAVGNMVHGQSEGREGAFPVPAAGSVQILKSTL